MKKVYKGKSFQRFVSAFMAVILVFTLMPMELKVDAATDVNTENVTDASNDTNTVVSANDSNSDYNEAISLLSTTIEDVTIASREGLIYTGDPLELVTVTKQEGDNVTYKVTKDGATEEPVESDTAVATDAGTYTIDYTVKRDGYDDLTGSVQTTIAKATIEGIDIMAVEGLKYNETEQALVTLTGEDKLLENDTVTWTVNDTTGDRNIPTGLAVGNYTVKLTVDRGSNYVVWEKSVEVSIALGDLELGELTITPNDRTYDKTTKDLVTVGNQGNYDLKYKLGDGEWQDTIPQADAAGNYLVYVKATKANYNDKNYSEVPVTVTIEKADQELLFSNSSYIAGGTSETTVTGDIPLEDSTSYDFTAIDKNESIEGNTITYSTDAASDVATIDASTGMLTVSYPGVITVTATLPGNDNYNECVITHTLTVSHKITAPGEYITLPQGNVNYMLGSSDTVSNVTATKKDAKIAGAITYSIKEEGTGLSIDANSGVVSVSDYNALAAKLQENNGSYTVNVVATKVAEGGYDEDSLSYPITITFDSAPENVTFTVEAADVDNDGTATVGDGWYSEGAKVTAPEGYQIAKDLSEDWADEVIFTDAGAHTRYVYLKDETTGAVTDKVAVEQEIKIDNVAPSVATMTVEFEEASLIRLIGERLGFYEPTVKIKFTAVDDLSGIMKFDYKYEKEDGSSDINEGNLDGEITINEDGVATATITLPRDDGDEQYRGEISFKATDKAGNTSDWKKGDTVLIIDDISPTMSIMYEGDVPYAKEVQEIEGTHYFSSAVDVELTVVEANLEPDYIKDFIYVSVSKDGVVETVEDITWTKNGDNNIGTFTLSADAEYIVNVTGVDPNENPMDPSENPMASYTSEKIVVDTIDPVIKAGYDEANKQLIVEVSEHNFRTSDMDATISVSGNDLSENEINELISYIQDDSKWIHGNDVHTLILGSAKNNSLLPDGYYDFSFTYKDLALNEAVDEKISFKLDSTPPDAKDIKITYSGETTWLEEKLGIYRENVTITFEAVDAMSDIKEFDWEYNRAKDASSAILKKDGGIEPAKGGKASVTLPREAAQQLKGHISVWAIDECGNRSKGKTDTDYIIAVDTIGPKLTVDYGLESNKVDKQTFYNKNVTATFTLAEDNFFEEDVKVFVSKNDGALKAAKVNWKKKKAGVYEGTYTIKNDGEYVFYVEYQDKSGNYLTDEDGNVFSYQGDEGTTYRYKSHVITVDKTLPEVKVEYKNQSPITTEVDKQNNNREYYADAQYATITIKEHNFDKEGVTLNIEAMDIAGGAYNVDSYITKSAWKSVGDTHTMTINYSGEANYTFDIECLDLAKNEAKDYEADYFTVDKTAPDNMTIEYSSSLLETVLEILTFGFYNAKMTVTISAEDQVSGVGLFEYSYINAEGVSSVNGDMLNQSAESSQLTYSGDGKTATYEFEIPEDVLREGTQFNGTVEFDVADRCENHAGVFSDDKRLVVDNIAPTLEVTYNDAVNEAGDISYYDGDINVTLTMTEANFYEEDVIVTVAKDGGAASAVTPNWVNESVDVHVGTFTLTEDGDYFVNVEYQDKSENVMEPYTSNQLTIDTDIQMPIYRINGVQKEEIGGAYKEDAVVAFSYEDENFDTQTIKLERIRFDSVEDITEEFIHASSNANGGSGTFEIPMTNENDGIYVLSVDITDKAMHTQESQLKFTINRYGSVYEYDDYLVSLIADGGQYITKQEGKDAAITEDLIITEYNAVELLEDSLNILVTKDGETIDVDYGIKENNADAEVNGWYQYVYEIKASNFAEDGVYKISLTSAYATDDSDSNESTSVSENSIDKKGDQILDTMTFTVDTVKPEIRNIVNLEESIVNAQSLDVKYTVVDVGGLESISIIVNGEELDKITDFGDNQFNYSGQFTLSESADAQKIQIKVVDLAGNVTDTAAEDFSTGGLYVFNDTVTVSTNIFVRWFANKALFWGTIGGVVALAGLSGLLVFLRSKRKSK